MFLLYLWSNAALVSNRDFQRYRKNLTDQHFLVVKKSRKLNYNGSDLVLCNRVLCRSRQIKMLLWKRYLKHTLYHPVGGKMPQEDQKTKGQRGRDEKRDKNQKKAGKTNTAAEQRPALPSLSLSSFPSIPPLSTTVHREDLQHLSLTLKSVSCAGVTGPLLAIHLNTTSLSRDCAGSSVCILHCLRAGVLI